MAADQRQIKFPPYQCYWGKARPNDEQGPAYHLLPYHCLDVAAVGWLLLAPEEQRCKRLAKRLNVDPEWLRCFVTFCLALHDIGKFARAFQGLRTDLSPGLVRAKRRMPYSQKHDNLGFALWDKVLEARLVEFSKREPEYDPIDARWPEKIAPWIEIVTGHHGFPPSKCVRIQDFFEIEDEQAALSFVLDVHELLLKDFDFLPLLDRTLKKRLKAVSWQLAGIAVLADWLGSNQDYFEYREHPGPLQNYWHDTALRSAKRAIAALPETPLINGFQDIRTLFPFIERPTPLQLYATDEPLSDQAQLFILEDVTGAGKTEAALILTLRLMARGLADGCYIALPTMATANAMYRRLGKVYRKFFSVSTNPSLILAHGSRDLSQDFEKSVTLAPHSQNDLDYRTSRTEDERELSASAYCNAWLADSRKKSLLADVGVGTLDQVLLSVLPVRHQSLRLLGLARKILLVDEVHAYDSYMQKLLANLLKAHARQGGSAILLSATLPQSMREALVGAFHAGMETDKAELNDPAPFPLATHFPAKRIEHGLDTREEVKRTVRIQRLDSPSEVIARLRQFSEAGKCVCWIRNTVKSARQSYQDLLDHGVSPGRISLFHSRFAMIDRQIIENRTLERFGIRSGQAQRNGRILIATQVVEQSLDLDFDEVITDLAPIDLIIQRAGRLRRHVRDEQGNRLDQSGAKDRRGPPTLYIHSPAAVENADAEWLKPDHAGTGAVYPHVGQLWLSVIGAGI